MKSRSCVAKALYEPKGVDRVAVVVVESTQAGILDEDEALPAMETTEGKRIYQFLERKQSLEPDPVTQERRVSSVGSLRDVVAYVCRNYPYKDELSNARVTKKVVYLAGWRSAITRGRQLTDLEWEFSHYGPYVSDVIRVAEADPDLER